MTEPIAVEFFSCAGGMAEGFRRAGIAFDLVVDKDPDAVSSYEQNLGHRPIQMDASDLLRILELGARLPPVRLLVADPPCTPWSRAGKRRGTEDARDMLVDTCRAIELVRPRCWLLGNVPGLDDEPNWHIVQQHIGSIPGYCVDYFKLDAADYGVPQRRIRPFWFGHPTGTACLRPPRPSHGDPDTIGHAELGDDRQPWRTCRDALSHLPPEQLGKPARMRERKSNGKESGSVPDRPARVVGTSNLSDGNVLSHPPDENERAPREFRNGHPPSEPDMPARTITSSDAGREHSGPLTLFVPEATATQRNPPFSRPPSTPDAPATTITTRGGRTEGANGGVLLTHPRHPVSEPDLPSRTVTTKGSGRGAQGACVLRSSQHGPQSPDKPAPPLTGSQPGPRSRRSLMWPWDRPSTTVAADNRIDGPGHHPKEWRSKNGPNCVVLSEKAGAILQGFPEDWVFAGRTKKSRWSMIGQAMPPALAAAVAAEIVRWLDG